MRSTLSPHIDHEYTTQCHCTCHKPPLLPPDFALGGNGSPQVPWSRHNSPRTKGSATVTWENDGSGTTKVWWSRHTKGKTGGAWKKPETVKRWTKPVVSMTFSWHWVTKSPTCHFLFKTTAAVMIKCSYSHTDLTSNCPASHLTYSAMFGISRRNLFRPKNPV